MSCLVFLLAICHPLYANEDYVVATIGEEKIYFSEIERSAQGLNRFLKENFETSKEWRLDYIRKYIAQIALAKKAENQGLDKDEKVILTLRQARQAILTDKLLNNMLAKIKVTDDDLKNFYEQNKVKYQIPEKIKTSYMKLKNKADAENLISKLNKGKGFDDLAGKKKVEIKDWMNKGAMMPMPGLEGVKPEDLNGLFNLGVGGTSGVIEAKVSLQGVPPAGGDEAILKTNKAVKIASASPRNDGDYVIFHIDAKEAAKDRPFEEVKQQVEFEYNQQTKNKAVSDFIMDSFKQEKVSIDDKKILEGMK